MARLFDELPREVTHSWRGLRAAPAFTLAAIATLAKARSRTRLARPRAQAGAALTGGRPCTNITPVTLEPGHVVGSYRVVSHLGTGGMGEVYLAVDVRLGRSVALKLLRPTPLQSNEHAYARFLREARLVSLVNHRHVVTLYDIVRDGTFDCLVMEYVKGETLQRLLARGPLPIAAIVDYATQIAAGLQAAHARGVLHRDLKPSNVIVAEEGGVKVLDFGIAKLLETRVGEAEAVTMTGPSGLPVSASTVAELPGTPPYMSPEQARGQPIDARTDVFSFGAVLYEMVTGRRAFSGETWTEVIAAVRDRSPRSVRELRPETPARLESLISDCLAKRADERPQSMGEVSRALAEVAKASDDAPRSSFTQLAAGGWLALVLAVASAGVVAWLTLGGSAGDRETRFRAVPITAIPGQEAWPTLSPDGSQVAFAATGDAGNWDIYVQSIAGSEPIRITNEATDELRPVWSPDGKWIVFLRRSSDGEGRVVRVPALGGAESRLAEMNCAPHSWSPDTRYLLCAGDTSRPGVFGIAWDGSFVRQLTKPSAGLVDIYPTLSPGGDRVVFVREDAGQYASGELWALDLAPSGVPRADPRRVVALTMMAKGLAWMPDGRDVLLSMFGDVEAGESPYHMVRLDPAQDNPTITPVSLPADAREPTVSRHGNRLVYSAYVAEADLWASDALGSHRHGLSSTWLEDRPRYSPDGQRVTFQSNRTGAWQVWVGQGGAKALQLTNSVDGAGHPSWSPDGAYLTFYQNDAVQADIFVLEADGGAPTRVSHTPSDEWSPVFSRDGRSIYFVSNRTGRGEVFRSDLRGQNLTQLTHSGASSAFGELADGRVLFQNVGNEVWEVFGGRERRLLGPIGAEALFASDSGVVFLEPSSGDAANTLLKRLDVHTRHISDVRSLAGRAIDVTQSPNGTYLYTRVVQRSDLMMVDGFR